MTTNTAVQHAAGARSVHIDHAAVVTVRMPTPDECAHGFPEGAPVLVVGDGVNSAVFPHWVMLQFDDPHGQPEPDAVRAAVLSVLGPLGEQLHLAGGRVADLAGAFRRSPCSVVHLADEVREEQEAAWRCADASMCEMICQPAGGPAEMTRPATG